jgi:phosphoserine aminotransferase
VLAQAAAEMLDWHGSGMSVMEMSHRGPEFMSIYKAAERDLRELLAVPDNYKILFMQGGGLSQNALIPLNLLGHKPEGATIDFIHTGSWSAKSIKEAGKYAKVNIAASKTKAVPAQAEWQLTPADAAYLHMCTNETIDGVEFQPDFSDARFADACWWPICPRTSCRA